MQAVSSKNIYSEHGFEAFIRAELEQGFHLLIVSWYWIPGSPHCQEASAIDFNMFFALTVSATSPLVTYFKLNGPN